MTATKGKYKNKRIATIFMTGISSDVKSSFKSWCAARGVSMTATIEMLMKETVRDQSKIFTHALMDQLRKKSSLKHEIPKII